MGLLVILVFLPLLFGLFAQMPVQGTYGRFSQVPSRAGKPRV